MARVFVITGPSGVGKGTLIRGLMQRLPELELSVSATTRAPRPGETTASTTTSSRARSSTAASPTGDFVEHADYAGRSYGTLRSELESRVRAGVPVVLEIEVQGARQVRAAMPEAVQVFIAPPSLEALRTRLVGRGTDDSEEVERRLRVAEQELDAQPEFGHVVVNDRLEEALEELTRDRRRRARLTPPSVAERAQPSSRAARTTLRFTEERQQNVISPRIDRLLEQVDSNYAERDRRRQARPADQQLLPQPRRGHLRRVPAADDRNGLEKLPHDRPRGGSCGKDEVPLPLSGRLGGARLRPRSLVCCSHDHRSLRPCLACPATRSGARG